MAALLAVIVFITVKAAPYAAGYFGAKAAVSWMKTPGFEKDMKAGFKDVGANWAGWVRLWEDSSDASFQTAGGVMAAKYLEEHELIEVYRFRANLFERLAQEPTLASWCSGTNRPNSKDAASKVDFQPLARLMGRGFARQHAGSAPRQPTVDLINDETVWAQFGDYLSANGMDDVRDMFVKQLNGQSVDDATLCSTQAKLYRRAADQPNDRLGRVRFVDFVHALDLLAVGASS